APAAWRPAPAPGIRAGPPPARRARRPRAAARAGARRRPRSSPARRSGTCRPRPSCRLPVAQPEGERVCQFAAADLVPGRAHGDARLAPVAALAPEGVVVAVAGRAARIVRVAVHRAERGPAEAQGARMRLAPVEEGMAHAQAPV